MDKSSVDKYIKRIQSKLTYRGQSATKQQCREAYQAIVKDGTAPTDAEIDLVVAWLAKSVQVDESVNLVPAISGVESEELEITPPSIVELTPESHPSVWETLQPPAAVQPEDSHPAKENSGLTIADSQPLVAPAAGVTHQQIQSAVAEQFFGRPDDIKVQVVQYASQLAFTSAKELDEMLSHLRDTEMTVMMQIIKTHNGERTQTLESFKEALLNANQADRQESANFFAQFSRQMAEMKASFGA